MLKVRTPALIAGYNEWHRKVWPELQSQIFLAGVTNYSIFQRPDGLLFLYMESNPVLAQQHSISSTEVSTRWEELMDPFLDPGFEYNGPLEHVMYMDPDPSTRSMQPIPASAEAPTDLSPMPPWREYESYTGGGGKSRDGRVRSAFQLKCRPDGIPAYNDWHTRVWPNLPSATQ